MWAEPAECDVVPVAVVFGQIAKALVRIEEHILMPAVRDALDMNGAPLESDDFVGRAANLATSSQRDQRRIFSGGCS